MPAAGAITKLRLVQQRAFARAHQSALLQGSAGLCDGRGVAAVDRLEPLCTQESERTAKRRSHNMSARTKAIPERNRELAGIIESGYQFQSTAHNDMCVKTQKASVRDRATR